MFNLTFAKGGAIADAIGAKLTSTAAGEAVAGKTIPVVGETVGAFARENLVLAMALTVPKLVSVDLNGFTFSDAAHLDFRKLHDAPVLKFAKLVTHDSKGFHLAPGIGSTVQDIGITLGSFVVAGAVLKPIFAKVASSFAKIGLRDAVEFAAERLGARVAAGAAVEVGALAVPGAGEVVDGVLLVGNVLWTAFDVIGFVVAPRAVALGTTMLVANAIQKPVQAANDQRQFDDATKTAVKNLMAVAAENNGHPDPAAFQAALTASMSSFRDQRDLAYLPAAIDDATLDTHLQNVGNGDYEAAMRTRDAKIASDAQATYGNDLAQIAQTVEHQALVRRRDSDERLGQASARDLLRLPHAGREGRQEHLRGADGRRQLSRPRVVELRDLPQSRAALRRGSGRLRPRPDDRPGPDAEVEPRRPDRSPGRDQERRQQDHARGDGPDAFAGARDRDAGRDHSPGAGEGDHRGSQAGDGELKLPDARRTDARRTEAEDARR